MMLRSIPVFLFLACLFFGTTGARAQNEPFLFVDADLDTVFSTIERLTGRSVLRPQALPNTRITFLPDQPLTDEEKLIALESLLSLNGVSLIEFSDKFIKAVPSANVLSEAPVLIVGSTLDMRPTEAVFAKIFKLEFLSAEEAATLINPLLGGLGTVTLQKSNWLLVADSLTNLQRIESLLDEIDRKQVVREEMRFFQIRNIPAGDIVRNIDELSSGPLARYFSGNTVVSAVESSNKLVVVAHPDSMEVIEQLIAEFDADVEPLTNSEVFYIRHAVATEVEAVIKSLITEQRRNEDDGVEVEENTDLGTDQSQPPPDPGQPDPSPEQGASISTTLTEAVERSAARMQFSKFASVVSDERSNAVIAYGTASDIKQIGSLIEQIDILLAQVRIEVVIVEVSLDETQVRGIDVFGLQYNTANTTPDQRLRLASSGAGDNASEIPFNLGAATFTAFALRDFSLQTVFDVARGNGDVTVLSAPTVMTTHNREARIEVAESRPIVTGSVINNDANATRSTVDFRDIGIELTVKPLIAETGVIQMEITQTVENVVSTITGTGNRDLDGQPIIGTREAESFVSVEDQEIIILGGLQERQRRLTKNKLAILGDLPVLGDWLFTRKQNDVTTRELIIFIKPNVMLSPRQASRDAEGRLDLLDEREAVETYLETGEFGDMPLPRINPNIDEVGPYNPQTAPRQSEEDLEEEIGE